MFELALDSTAVADTLAIFTAGVPSKPKEIISLIIETVSAHLATVTFDVSHSEGCVSRHTHEAGVTSGSPPAEALELALDRQTFVEMARSVAGMAGVLPLTIETSGSRTVVDMQSRQYNFDSSKG